MGLPVVKYAPGLSADFDRVAFFIGADWDDAKFDEYLAHFLSSHVAARARALVVGPWGEDMFEESIEAVIDVLADNGAQLPNVVGMFLGDIIQEENEMSWIVQADLSPILTAFPQLQLLRTRGGNGLKLSRPEHECLRALALETGGMDSSVLSSVIGGKFPNLEYLELWLGTEEYGGTCSVEDLQPLFTGTRFPKLRYLGLRNCDFVDDIASVLPNAPIARRLEVIDLSLGTLTDAGGRALLQMPTDGPLKRLDLHYNYLTEAGLHPERRTS